MAVPHLDTRILDGKKTLLFGPFAAWTTHFLHRTGSWLDLPLTVRPHNVTTLLKIAATNVPLVRYLVGQGLQSMEDRMRILRVFYPEARAEDWRLQDAGIRVQSIKKTDGEAGIVHYGTEVVTSEDKSMAALLGASPGASTSVNIDLEVLRNCFPRLFEGEEAKALLSEVLPTFGEDWRVTAKAGEFGKLQKRAREILQLVGA